MTRDEVNELRDKLRVAQLAVEAAGREVCDERSDRAAQMWGRLTAMAEDLGELVHFADRLREDKQ